MQLHGLTPEETFPHSRKSRKYRRLLVRCIESVTFRRQNNAFPHAGRLRVYKLVGKLYAAPNSTKQTQYVCNEIAGRVCISQSEIVAVFNLFRMTEHLQFYMIFKEHSRKIHLCMYVCVCEYIYIYCCININTYKCFNSYNILKITYITGLHIRQKIDRLG